MATRVIASGAAFAVDAVALKRAVDRDNPCADGQREC